MIETPKKLTPAQISQIKFLLQRTGLRIWEIADHLHVSFKEVAALQAEAEREKDRREVMIEELTIQGAVSLLKAPKREITAVTLATCDYKSRLAIGWLYSDGTGGEVLLGNDIPDEIIALICTDNTSLYGDVITPVQWEEIIDENPPPHKRVGRVKGTYQQ